MDFKAFDKVSYGLYLISTKAGDKTAGCVVNTFGQVTVTPTQVTVAVNKQNCTAKLIEQSGVFSAVVLAQDASMELIGAFGFHSSEEKDKFQDFSCAFDKNGIPYVSEQAVARFCCRVVNTMDAGTHLIFLAEVEEAALLKDAEPMTYAYYHLVKKGVTPPKASSYQPKAVKGWRCKVCGYVLESDTIPDDFVCPVCGQGREQFEQIFE